MNLNFQRAQFTTRRHFLKRCQLGLGSLALGSLMGGAGANAAAPAPLSARMPHARRKIKNVIYLHMAGSPPQLDLFDYKPKLNELNDTPCPKEFIEGRRLPFIRATRSCSVHRTRLSSTDKTGSGSATCILS